MKPYTQVFIQNLLRKASSVSRPKYNLVRPGKVTPIRPVPSNIACPGYYRTGQPANSNRAFVAADSEDIRKVRAAGRLARKILDFACNNAKPGMTTEELDILCHNEIVKHGAYPSPINYAGFPKAICTSVNDAICHGIPDDRVLEDGDVLSIDVSVFKDGFHGDNCGTIIVGTKKDEDAVRLVDVTRRACEEAVAICRPGECISKIGSIISDIAERERFGVNEDFCGHGVGPNLHMPPLIRHFRNNNRLSMVEGMVFTIEPILVEGGRRMSVCSDNWTAVTMDGGRGAQFEHQLLITKDGHEILTIPE